jgi:hypothetical protein
MGKLTIIYAKHACCSACLVVHPLLVATPYFACMYKLRACACLPVLAMFACFVLRIFVDRGGCMSLCCTSSARRTCPAAIAANKRRIGPKPQTSRSQTQWASLKDVGCHESGGHNYCACVLCTRTCRSSPQMRVRVWAVLVRIAPLSVRAPVALGRSWPRHTDHYGHELALLRKVSCMPLCCFSAACMPSCQ